MTLGHIFGLVFAAVFSVGVGGFSLLVMVSSLGRGQVKAAAVALLFLFCSAGVGVYGWSLL